jgi:hypothetical protein
MHLLNFVSCFVNNNFCTSIANKNKELVSRQLKKIVFLKFTKEGTRKKLFCVLNYRLFLCNLK